MAEIWPAYEAVAALPEVTMANVLAGTSYFWDSKNGKTATTTVSALVSVKRPIADKEAEAAKVARIVLQAYPAAAGKDAIQVTVSEGFDIGIASSWVSQTFVHRPREWREKVGTAAPTP